MAKPAWQMYGGKSEMLEWLYTHLPSGCTTFVDVCGGSAAVLLGLSPAWPVEVYNDIDGTLVNFFRVARESPEKLALSLLLTPYSRLAFEQDRNSVEAKQEADEELARCYAAVAKASMNGIWGRSWSRAIEHSRRGMSSSVSRWLNLPEEVLKVAERMAQVQIENLDAVACLTEYDRETTFFYIDPPYPADVASPGYRHDMPRIQHAALLGACKACRGKVMVSSYRNELYDRDLSGWRIEERSVKCRSNVTTRGSKGSRPSRVEVLYMNF